MFQNLVILTEKLVIANWCMNDENSFHEKLDMNNVHHIYIFLSKLHFGWLGSYATTIVFLFLKFVHFCIHSVGPGTVWLVNVVNTEPSHTKSVITFMSAVNISNFSVILPKKFYFYRKTDGISVFSRISSLWKTTIYILNGNIRTFIDKDTLEAELKRCRE